MYVNLYTDNIYSQKIRINDQTLYGAHAEPTISTRTIGEVEYKYFKNLIVYDPLGAAGTIIANAVTDPAGDVNNYKAFYLIGNNRVDVKNYYAVDPNDPDKWIVTISIRLIVSGIEIDTMGLTRSVTTDPATQPYYYNISFASLIVDGTLYYGFVYSDSPDTYCQLIAISQNFYEQSIAKPYDGGAAGSDPGSGYGDNDTDSTDATRIGSLNGILAGSGHGLHVYELDGTAYSELINDLFNKQVDFAISRSIWDLSDSIISVHRLPVLDRSQTTTSTIVTGGFLNIAINNGTVKMDTTNICTVDSGDIPVGTIQSDFLDYSATTAILYLPFCGTIPISIQDIMRGSLRVIYKIDLVQGNCVANVYTRNYQGREKLQGTYSGNCAYRIPLMGSSDGSGQIAGLIQTAVGAVSGNAMAAGSGMISAIGASMSPTVYAAGSTGGNSAYYSDTECSLIIYRPNAIYPDQYSEILGRPTGSSSTVGHFSGLVSGSMHIELDGATEAENRAIEALFKEGVIV